ncbi:testis-specific serine/threonine-protein kinase 3-like [Oscarella lobularis]|uniref:testis-specific serine/threonine-protein kinase 3-like n=1 Tax=Oscarella lobularis TaxID=121494 RepID=UPI0033134801
MAGGDIDKYALGATLGTGAYAKVKLAQRRDSGAKLAVKIVNKKRAPKDYLAKFLCREMEVLSQLQHQHIIKLHEILETEQKVYFVMDVAEGGDLLDYINNRGYLSEDESRRVLRQTVLAVQHCHENGIVHRDLKCENILLDKNNDVKVSDFGFARPFRKSQLLETFCGSYAYASPQILNGEPYEGNLSDIWSMGVVAFAMVCGRLPFNDSNVKVLMAQIRGRLNFSSRTSPECRDLIRKMLAIRAEERITIKGILRHPFLAVESTSPTKTIRPPSIMCASPHSTAAFKEIVKEEEKATIAAKTSNTNISPKNSKGNQRETDSVTEKIEALLLDDSREARSESNDGSSGEGVAGNRRKSSSADSQHKKKGVFAKFKRSGKDFFKNLKL